MKIKFQKRVKKTFAVLFAVMLAVCSMAFSVSADEVIFNGTITKGDENGDGGYMYDFPSYVPLENGITYEFTALDQTVSGIAVYIEGQGVGGYIVDIPGFGQFGSIPSANLSQLSLNVGVYPDTIDLVITSTGATDQSQDVLIFNESLPFENIFDSYSVLAPSNIRLIAGREYLVEINGIKRQYIAELKEIGGDSGIVLGPVPNVDGEISVTTTNYQGSPAIIINADNLLPGKGTYPVKITLLGIKPPSFLGSVTDAIGSVLSWVGIPINEMLNDGGALVALLPLFAIGISIAAIFVGIKLIRSFTWGN